MLRLDFIQYLYINRRRKKIDEPKIEERRQKKEERRTEDRRKKIDE